MKHVWDQKYAGEDYFYGTEPNVFMIREAGALPAGARVLVTGDGEGRNGVWLARQGFDVTSVDYSQSGLDKAARLAERHDVSLSLIRADLLEWNWPIDHFDALITVFLHFAPAQRRQVHKAMQTAIRPGGLLIAELFHPEQIKYASGGPKAEEMLVTAADMRADFPGIDWLLLEETRTELDEGRGHQGPGMVTHGVGRRTDRA